MPAPTVTLSALDGIPLIGPGDDLAALIADALQRAAERLLRHDILVVAQKVVSKAEDRLVSLSRVTPSARALALAQAVDKDPRIVELILSESREVVRAQHGVIITEHRSGVVMANAGIDMSNVGEAATGGQVLLLPEDPDRSCRRLRGRLRELTGCDVGVIINDSVGRAWREGTVGLAIGVSGVPARLDLRGETDLFGRAHQVTEVGLADCLASAASVLMGEGDEGRPVVLIRGLRYADDGARASDILRPKERDLFR